MTGSPDLAVVLAAVALPFAAAATIPLVYRVLGERTGYYGAAVALACVGLLASQHGTTGVVGVEWIPALSVGLHFYVDAWALLFAFLASGVGVLVFVYSAGYMHGESSLPRYYATLLAFMGSIVGVALATDLLALFLFWELTSVCSFVLIAHHATDPDSQYAARMAMVLTVGGGLFLLVGLVLLRIAATGVVGDESLHLAAMLERDEAVRASLRSNGYFLPLLLLVGLGAATKSAQVPLHFWLPNAMAAPTPVSAFLHSATMVKVGVYLLGRLRPLLLGPEWTALFATLGVLTMLVTAVLAVAATDVKELLAYSTASHLGLMVAGFGFAADYGAGAGVFHLLNHATFKAALFLVAGILAHQAGTRALAEMGGLRRDLPVTAAIAGVAALGMAGLPPFNGFYSKELLFEAAYEAGHGHGGLWWVLPAAAVLASVFTVLYSLRFLALFLGDRPDALGAVPRPPATLLVPPAVLAVVAGALGLFPGLAGEVVVNAGMTATGGDPGHVHLGLPTALSPALAMSAISLGGGAVAYPAYGRLHGGIRRVVAAVPPARPSWWYDRALRGLARGGAVAVPRVQNGVLRTYATWMVASAFGLALLGFAAADVAVPAVDPVGVSPTIAVVLFVGVVAAAAAATAPAHVVGVLLLSLLGLMLAIFFILASAPDLALTQLVVETLALLLFLLVVEELPAFYGELDRRRAARDAVLSLAVGGTVFLTVLLTAGRAESVLAQQFVEWSVDRGGGTNVVNVILTDFRAFDTLGESVVIAIAAISVLTLVLMRDRGESP